nr:pectinesterase family protein [uncultured Carboxylicivirga sp.]
MRLFISILCVFYSINIWADNQADIVVAADGTGDYNTLTDAISQLPYYNYERVVIFVKNGIYNEKIRIEKDYLTIRGESRDSTIIEYAQLREDWIEHPDIIGPAVINIEADDIVLDNLTIRNTQPEIGPHAFAILGNGTRTILTNCNITSKGGDTVSLWNYKQGMYYHANCYFEGCVDFVCPRGWCFIKDSEFHQLKNTATLWHAAVDDKEKKFVLQNCKFTGVDGWQLGRHHYEAAFYLIDCSFGKGMADTPIYYVSYPDKPEKNRPYFWKDRYYFSGCKGDGFHYNWFDDNFISKGLVNLSPSDLSPSWTFNQRWDPESKEKPYVSQIKIVDKQNVFLEFNESVGADNSLKLQTETGIELVFMQGTGRNILQFSSLIDLKESDLKQSIKIIQGKIGTNTASVTDRTINIGETISTSKTQITELSCRK